MQLPRNLPSSRSSDCREEANQMKTMLGLAPLLVCIILALSSNSSPSQMFTATLTSCAATWTLTGNYASSPTWGCTLPLANLALTTTTVFVTSITWTTVTVPGPTVTTYTTTWTTTTLPPTTTTTYTTIGPATSTTSTVPCVGCVTIPGFPLEAIFLGLLIGLCVLILLRRKR